MKSVNTLLQELEEMRNDLNKGANQLLSLHGKKVVVQFGSARSKPNSKAYKTTKEIGEAFAAIGYYVITGAGPGTMAAANEGAKMFDPRMSGGVGISTLKGETKNKYMSSNITYMTEFFFVRKILEVDVATAFLFVEGGVGTMDELFEVLTLMATGTISKRPIYIYNVDNYYKPVFNLLEHFIKHGNMDKSVMDLITVATTKKELINKITVNEQLYVRES